MGFWDYAVLIDPMQPIGGPNTQTFPLVYRQYEREIVFRNPLAELPDLYNSERQRCGGRYVAKRRRHYAPQFGGQARLIKEVGLIVERLQRQEPDSIVDLEETPFRLYASGWM